MAVPLKPVIINVIQKLASGGGQLAADSAKVAGMTEKALTKTEAVIAKKTMSAFSKAVDKKTIDTFEKVSCKISEHNTATRDKFVKTIEEAGVSPQVTKKLKNAKTWGELQAAIYSFQQDFNKVEIEPILRKIPKKRSGMPLEIEQMFYQKKNLLDDCNRYLHALFSPPSRNPKVIEIEKILKEKYGVDLALLADDLPNAQKILKAVETAKDKGIPIPRDFIVTNYKSNAEHLRTYDGRASSILLGSNMFKIYMGKHRPKVEIPDALKDLMQIWQKTRGFSSWFSTTNPEHVVMHEIMHQEHLPFLAFKRKKIPKKFATTINRLSGYAASKPQCAHETFTELNTKRILSELTPEEQELFKFLSES